CASGAPSVAWRDAPRSLAIGFRRAHGLWDLATSNDPSIDVSQAVSLLVPGVFLLDEGSPRVPELSPLGGRSFEEPSEAAGDVLHVGAHDDSPFAVGELGEVAGGRDERRQSARKGFEDRHAEAFTVAGQDEGIGRAPDGARALARNVTDPRHTR